MKCVFVISPISDFKKIGANDLRVHEEVYLWPYVNYALLWINMVES
jgi:hypothetical protein